MRNLGASFDALEAGDYAREVGGIFFLAFVAFLPVWLLLILLGIAGIASRW